MYLTSEQSSLKQTVTAKSNDRNEPITPGILEMKYLDAERLSDLPKATQQHSSFHSTALSGSWFMLFPL